MDTPYPPHDPCSLCHGSVHPRDFRSVDAYRAYWRDGSCQTCQDLSASIMRAPSAATPADIAVHRAVVLAARGTGAELEAACLPAVFVSGQAPVLHALDLHRIARVGPALPAPALPDDLEFLSDALSDQRALVTVTDAVHWTEPALAEALHGARLWVTADRHTLECVHAVCPPPLPAMCIVMSCFAEVALGPDYDPAPSDSGCALLRCCAWLTSLLRTPYDGTSTLFTHMLAHPGVPFDPGSVLPGSAPPVVVSARTAWPSGRLH